MGSTLSLPFFLIEICHSFWLDKYSLLLCWNCINTIHSLVPWFTMTEEIHGDISLLPFLLSLLVFCILSVLCIGADSPSENSCTLSAFVTLPALAAFWPASGTACAPDVSCHPGTFPSSSCWGCFNATPSCLTVSLPSDYVFAISSFLISPCFLQYLLWICSNNCVYPILQKLRKGMFQINFLLFSHVWKSLYSVLIVN